MKKIKEFMDKPITWGAYTKLCVGSFVTSMAITGLVYGKLIYDIKKRNKELDNEIESEQDEDNVIEFTL